MAGQDCQYYLCSGYQETLAYQTQSQFDLHTYQLVHAALSPKQPLIFLQCQPEVTAPQ